MKKKKKTKPVEEEQEEEAHDEVDSLSFKSRFQRFFLRIVSSSLFEGFIIFCIMLNTILMASEHYKMPKALEKTIEVCNYVSLNSINLLCFWISWYRNFGQTMKTAGKRLYFKKNQVSSSSFFSNISCQKSFIPSDLIGSLPPQKVFGGKPT